MTRDRLRWPRLALHTWTLWALAVAPLLDVLRRYPEFLIAHDVGATRLGLLLVVGLVLLPLPWVLLAWAAQRRQRWLPWLLLPPLTLLGFELAVGADIGLGALVLGPAIAAGAFWAYRKWAALRRYCTWLVPVALVAPVLLFADSGIRKLWLPQTTIATGNASARGAPVVVLVLDELPITTLLDDGGRLDRHRFPHLAALAEQAHWFDNVVSVDSSTPKSVSALLTGTQLGRAQLPIARDLPRNLFTLLAPTYRIAALEPVTRLCPSELNVLGGATQANADWLVDTAIVALHLVVPAPFNVHLPSIDAQWTGFGNSASSSPSGELRDSTNWQRIFKQAGRQVRRNRLAGFEQLLAAIDTRRQGALYFAHLLLPHRPWVYLPTGSTYIPRAYRDGRVSQESAWPPSASYAAQAYQRHLLQAEFVDHLIGGLVERLREQGIYDSALIAVTADHGISFLPGEMKRGVTATNRADVLQVPLLLKLPGQVRGVVHPEPRSTLDLMPTLLAVLGIASPASIEGRSLLDPPTIAAPEAPWRPALARRTAIFGPLDDAGSAFTFGPYASWIGRRLSEVELARDERFDLELEGPGYSFEHRAGSQPLPAWVYGRLKGPESSQRLGLAVAVDGTVRATTEYDPADRSDRFRALLPESALAPGVHELTLVVIDPETGRAVLPAAR